MKEELSIVSNCMLIGDKRKFLALLVTLKVHVDEEGHPSDNLTHAVIEVLQGLGSSATTMTAALEDPLVIKHIEQGVIKRNQRAVSNAQKIQKFKLLPRDFSVPGGELGPTLKLKRQVVLKMYSELIEALYTGDQE